MIKKIRKLSKDSSRPWLTVFVLGVIFFGVAGFMVVSNFRINQKRSEMLNEIDSLQKQIQDLENRNGQLESGLEDVGTQSSLEERAREQGYKKTGEEAVVVLPAQEKTASSTESQENFLQKLLGRLGF